MTVLAKEQADELLAALPKTDYCDACSQLFRGSVREVSHGPFTVYVCPHCEWKIKKMRYREKQK